MITKLDDVAKVVGLDVLTTLKEQLKDPVLSVVRSWIEGSISPDLRTSEIRQSKGLLRYRQELDRLLVEEGDTAPFCSIHIDHKGPLNPPSNRNTHCLLIVESFSRFLMVYPFANTGAQTTNAAVENWILHFGIPQFI